MFVYQGTQYVEFNGIILCTILYSQFQNCAENEFMFTAKCTSLEYGIK